MNIVIMAVLGLNCFGKYEFEIVALQLKKKKISAQIEQIYKSIEEMWNIKAFMSTIQCFDIGSLGILGVIYIYKYKHIHIIYKWCSSIEHNI